MPTMPSIAITAIHPPAHFYSWGGTCAPALTPVDSAYSYKGTPTPQGHSLATIAPQDIISALLADKRSAATRRAYAGDLAAFFGAPSVNKIDPAAVRVFLASDQPTVAIRLNKWKGEMLTAELSEATVNRRLSAVRALLKLAHRYGHASTDGRNVVDGEKVESYRDTTGYDMATVRALIAAPGTSTLKGKRDTAILHFLYANGRRRGEVCSLRVRDYEPEQRRVMVLGKGKGTQRKPIILADSTITAINDYLAASGHADKPDAPLFCSLQHQRLAEPSPMSGNAVWLLCQEHGAKIGRDIHPHGLRHTAITKVGDITNGDLRAMQEFADHADPRTTMKYDDNRRGRQGQLTRALAELV